MPSATARKPSALSVHIVRAGMPHATTIRGVAGLTAAITLRARRRDELAWSATHACCGHADARAIVSREDRTSGVFFGYEAGGSAQEVTAAFSEPLLSRFWSTDGWANVYARSRMGGLVRCTLP